MGLISFSATLFELFAFNIGLDLATHGNPYPLAARFNEMQRFVRLDTEPADWSSWRIVFNPQLAKR